MPTVFTHALLPALAAAALPRVHLPGRLLALGMVAATLPDADVISRHFGIPHTADFGHRGATHTLLFAFLAGCFAAMIRKPLRAERHVAFLFILLSTLSHPLADMLTEGGKGIMLFWPLDNSRWKFPVHPVEASPVGLQALRTGTIWNIIASEVLWLLLPAALLAGTARFTAKRRLADRP